MILHERQQQILSILQKRHVASIGFLCTSLFASEATVRRDLAFLEKGSLLRRVRGGAAVLQSASQNQALFLQKEVNKTAKEHIAQIALRYLKNSSTSFFDSSSTVNYLAKAAAGGKDNLTIISNGLHTISLLNDNTDFKIIGVGGTLIDHSSFVGERALGFIDSYCAHSLFFSCCGITNDGKITEAIEENATVKKHMLKNSTKKILLCDSSKFAKLALCQACTLSLVDIVITEKPPESKELLELAKFIWE